jgi:phosphoenolpyruvate carboxylase
MLSPREWTLRTDWLAGVCALLDERHHRQVLNPKKKFHHAPYRAVLSMLRDKLMATRRRMEDLLAGVQPTEEDHFESAEELAAPLLACYRSLWHCGAGIVAEGRLLDVIRRTYVFGLQLTKLDLRQESERHTEAMNTVTEYLGLGSYKTWTEEQKVSQEAQLKERLRIALGKHRPHRTGYISRCSPGSRL